jgi:hypothetical protein
MKNTNITNLLLLEMMVKLPIIPYILESNAHPFYSFRGLKNQMRIRLACGLDSRSRAGIWKNDWAAVQYNNNVINVINKQRKNNTIQ